MPGGTRTHNPMIRSQVPYLLGHMHSMKNSILTQLVGLKSRKSWCIFCRLSVGYYQAWHQKDIAFVHYAYDYSKTQSQF